MKKLHRVWPIVAMLILIFGAQLYTTKAFALRDSESYIVVVLKSVELDDDRDPWYGELELATVVTAEGVKEPQTAMWPRKDEGSSWHEVDVDAGDPRDNITINMPIFLKKESEIGDEMAIVVTAVDNDEKPGWLDTFMDFVFQLGGEVAKKLEAPDWVSQAMKIAKQVYGIIDKIFPDAEKYGIYTRILHLSEWESGYLRVVERAANIEVGLGLARSDLWVEYEVRRIQVPVRTPPLAVKLKSITAYNWAGLLYPLDDEDGDDGEVIVKTRAYNDVAIKGPLVQMSEWGTTETDGPIDLERGETWTPQSIADFPKPDNVIYKTDAIGAFLYVEIGVWDKDYFGNNDLIAMYCHTFWPDENWGIGQVIRQNISRSNLGRWVEHCPDQYVEIELEIYSHLWFSDVEVSIPTPEWEVNVEETAAYAVKVKNWGNLRDHYEVTVEGIDVSWYSWGVGFDPADVELDPEESAWGTLIVIPARHWSTSPGRYEFTVTATSFSPLPTTHGSDSCVSSIKIRSFFDVEVLMPADAETVKAGRAATWTIGVRNLGNVRTDFRLSINCLDFDESLANLWPNTLWDMEPGRTGNGFLQISIPPDWVDATTYHFEITAIEITGQAQDTIAETFTTIPLEPGEAGVKMKLTEGLDYLFREDVKIRIAAIVTDVLTHQPISDAEIHIDIYHPDGTLWIASESMTEIDGTGIYEWQSNATILDLMKQSRGGPKLIKGVYLVHATTLWNGHVAEDIVELHIDPPAAEYSFLTQYVVAAIIGLAFVATIFLAAKKRQTNPRPQRQ